MSMVVEKPLSIVIVYTLALGAVYAASYRGLTKHIKRLQHDTDTGKKELNSKEEGEKDKVATASDAESQPAKESKPTSKWEKWRVGLAAVGTVCVMWGIGLLLAFGLPKIATPGMLDVIWMLLVGHQIWMVYRELIANILPDPRNMDIRWSRWNTITWTRSATEYPGPTPQTTPRRVVIAISTLATLAGVYTGIEWIIAFPVAALVYVAVSSTMIPDRSVRSILKWMLFIQVAVIAFTGLMMGGSCVYRLYYPIDPTKPKSTDPKPSQEVLLLMMMFSSSMPLVVSGHLIGLALRFDYTRALRSNIISAPTITSSTTFVKLQPYPKPFFKASFSTLSIILLNFGISQLTPNGTMNDAGLMIYAFCIPATIVGVRMIGVAAQEGAWEEFMGYTELGRKALREQQKDEQAVEKLTSDDEKGRLTAA